MSYLLSSSFLIDGAKVLFVLAFLAVGIYLMFSPAQRDGYNEGIYRK